MGGNIPLAFGLGVGFDVYEAFQYFEAFLLIGFRCSYRHFLDGYQEGRQISGPLGFQTVVAYLLAPDHIPNYPALRTMPTTFLVYKKV